VKYPSSAFYKEKTMRKFMFLLGFGLFLSSSAFALSFTNVYNAKVSNAVLTDTTTIHPDVASANVRIKSIAICNPSTTAQTVTLYKNVTSTPTVAAVAAWEIPGVAGMYYPIVPVVLNDDENFNCPNFAVRTSTSTNPVTVTILYK
jgi:hypothetical protein